jgi:AraC family transcriptional regulator, regulatory protein of adaptative response / methylated-DNA-[protein]-cysteine methyltransferase
MVDDDIAWAALLRRDRGFDGQFVTGVLSTGIYCRPSCAARHPARRHVRFFVDGAAARSAGLRACLRCLPDDVARDRKAVERALAMLEGDDPPRLEALAQAVGYAPHHFQRLFKRAMGMTPAAYARSLRGRKLGETLRQEERVTDAIYDAGYNAPSRAYADAVTHLGMTPGAWAKGGRGVAIRYAVVDSALGKMLVAATDKGLCRISFDEGEAELRARFPNAEIVEGDADFAGVVGDVVALVADPARGVDLPVDVQGTLFQQAIWAALRAIPAGETRTYSEIAAAAGRPRAVRAAGSACGDNGLAVLIPCHRVLRTDGSLGGYAYGLERKQRLLEREGALPLNPKGRTADR